MHYPFLAKYPLLHIVHKNGFTQISQLLIKKEHALHVNDNVKLFGLP